MRLSRVALFLALLVVGSAVENGEDEGNDLGNVGTTENTANGHVTDNVMGGSDVRPSVNITGNSGSTYLEKLVDQCLVKAWEQVHAALDRTEKDQMTALAEHRPPSPRRKLREIRRPARDVVAPSTAGEIYFYALECLKEETGTSDKFFVHLIRDWIPREILRRLARRSGCTKVETPTCNPTEPYRTITGECNNLQNPTWGRAIIPFKRVLPSNYQDGISAPVAWNPQTEYNGHNLPSARLVSSELLATGTPVANDEAYTHMLMQWGQFLDHDLDFTPMVKSDFGYGGGGQCDNKCDRFHPCFPIKVPEGDERLDNKAVPCLSFVRSATTCKTSGPPVQPRQQINQITSYIDASQVYGSSQAEQDLLRDPEDRRLLKVGTPVASGKYLLPHDMNHTVDCELEEGSGALCFLAGDKRVNEQVALIVMHTIWMREHNRLAKTLSTRNPGWSQEKVFQEARKIVYAEMEHITYNEWLPKIIGPIKATIKGIPGLGPYAYNPSTDASISNEFATAVFRFGHTQIQPQLFRLNANFKTIPQGHLELHKAFFSPNRIANDEEGGIDPILRGLFAVPAKRLLRKQYMNTELTEKLFALANQIAMDLASLNIQRGRDHGLRFYNDYREECGLKRAKSFRDLKQEIAARSVRRTLEYLYKHPDNIDLFVGLVTEDTLPGARVGPTLRCLLVRQFTHIRDGDRFWYENEGVFTTQQLQQLKKSSLARVICDNSDSIARIQRSVFEMTYDYLDCDEIPKVNLDPWVEE